MKKSLIALAVLAALAGTSVRARTGDVALTYRMGAGNPGDINRAHPFSAVPRLQDSAQPVRLYGDPVLYSATAGTVRSFVAGDTAVTKIKGVLVRPAAISQTTGGMTASFGTGVPPQGSVAIDVLEDGYIMVKCNNFGASPCKLGDPVYVWCVANSGNHVQGGLENAASAGNTAAIANAEWVSPPDANGNAEIRVWRA